MESLRELLSGMIVNRAIQCRAAAVIAGIRSSLDDRKVVGICVEKWHHDGMKPFFSETLAAYAPELMALLEPAISFVKASNEATLWKTNPYQTKERDFFTKVGSNRKITNKQLVWEPRGA